MTKWKGLGRCLAAFFGFMAVSAASVIPGFAYDKISLSSCEVENKHSIVIEGTAQAGETAEGEVPDDGYYYLFELHPYESGSEAGRIMFPGAIRAKSCRFQFPTAGIRPIPGCIPGLWRR